MCFSSVSSDHTFALPAIAPLSLLLYILPPQDQVPFAVVGSTDEIVVGGHKVRARQYPWGTVEGESLNYIQYHICVSITVYVCVCEKAGVGVLHFAIKQDMELLTT